MYEGLSGWLAKFPLVVYIVATIVRITNSTVSSSAQRVACKRRLVNLSQNIFNMWEPPFFTRVKHSYVLAQLLDLLGILYHIKGDLSSSFTHYLHRCLSSAAETPHISLIRKFVEDCPI